MGRALRVSIRAPSCHPWAVTILVLERPVDQNVPSCKRLWKNPAGLHALWIWAQETTDLWQKATDSRA